MPDLCPTKREYGFFSEGDKITCNLSGRHKITPGENDGLITGQGSSGWTNVNPDGETASVNGEGIKPSGLIPFSTGELKFDPWRKGARVTICGRRDKNCYDDYNLSDSDIGGPNISKLDEYYTGCGFGLPSLWPDDQLREGNVNMSLSDYKHWYGDHSAIIFGQHQTEEINCDAPFPSESGFPLIESNTCKLYEERTQLSQNLAQGIGSLGGRSEEWWTGGGEYVHGDIGCHYNYRKDWDNIHNSAPPLCMDRECSVINPVILNKQGARTHYDDNLIPKIRMACCTNVDGSGNWDNSSELNKEDCPITGLDDYTNNDIKEYGHGVYDPKSHVCARYDLSDGLFDTPDNWCSYKILQSDRFRDNTSPELLAPPQNSINSFPKEEYLTYIKLLCDEQCIKWLELDFQSSGNKWTEVNMANSLFKNKDKSTSDRINTYYDTKYRNKALGKKLAKFFVWVSKHLAQPTLTPIGVNYPRYDLVQQEVIEGETNNNEKISWQLKSKGLDDTFEVARSLGRETTVARDGQGNGVWLDGLCPSGQSMSGRYLGRVDISGPVRTHETQETCQDAIDKMPLLTQDDLDGLSRKEKQNYNTMKADGFCGSVGGQCHADSDTYKCESKFYQLKQATGLGETFPCVKYNKDGNGRWVKDTPIGGKLVSPPGLTSTKGCGYSDPISLESIDIPGDIQKFKCSESPRLDICCSSLNAAESVDNIDALLQVENNINKNENGLLSKNFRANSNLGKFLNLLCTPAAGAFLHFSPANNSVTTPNPDKIEFIKNMKIFSNRSDIFNWKDAKTASQNKDYNKKYNELLKRRYSRLCNCFWDSQFKYVTPGEATEGATTAETTTSEKPGWCLTSGVNCVEYELDEYKNEECNPVAIRYYNIAFLSQCANIQGNQESTETDYLGDAAASCRNGVQDDASSLIAFAMKFQMDDNPYTKRAQKNDNSCWYDGCNGLNNGSNSENITDGNSNYGFKTLNSKAYIDSNCNAFDIKSLNCLATAGVSAGHDLTITDSPIDLSATTNCSLSPVCSEGEIFSDEIENGHRTCEPASPPRRTQVQETFSTEIKQTIDANTPTPSPTPSDDISIIILIVVSVVIAIFGAALAVYLLKRFGWIQ